MQGIKSESATCKANKHSFPLSFGSQGYSVPPSPVFFFAIFFALLKKQLHISMGGGLLKNRIAYVWGALLFYMQNNTASSEYFF